jgi:hypothetical protein
LTTIVLRVGTGTPANGVLRTSEPAFDNDLARPRLMIGDANGVTRVLADPVYIEQLEARIRLLEQALRELQFIAWTGTPTFIIPP